MGTKLKLLDSLLQEIKFHRDNIHLRFNCLTNG